MKRIIALLMAFIAVMCLSASVEAEVYQKGNSGETVLAIQKSLCTLNYLSEQYATGEFEDMTELALIAFQVDHGLTPTGIADEDTQKAIAKVLPEAMATKVPTGAAAFVGRTVGRGSEGELVQQIQSQLFALGYYNDYPDGIYGYDTFDAVTRFQKYNSLPVTGEVDEKTAQSLFSAKAISAPTVAITPIPTPKPTKKPESTKSWENNQSNKKNVSTGTTYVLNTNSKKFHYPYCGSVKKMSPANYMEYTGSREDVISMGYDPCKKCNP